MRFWTLSVIPTGTVLVSGGVVVPSNGNGIGFYGPFPAVFVAEDRGYYGRERGYERRRYDDRRHHDRRYRRDDY